MKTVQEIEKMLVSLGVCIDRWEEDMIESGFGVHLFTLQNESSRQEYAGWLAQREFLKKLLLKAVYDFYACPKCKRDSFEYDGVNSLLRCKRTDCGHMLRIKGLK